MTVDYTKNYLKQYAKLPRKIQQKADERIILFVQEPSNPQLHDHALKGRYQGYRSINITGDIRALYRWNGTHLILFAFIGSHSELY